MGTTIKKIYSVRNEQCSYQQEGKLFCVSLKRHTTKVTNNKRIKQNSSRIKKKIVKKIKKPQKWFIFCRRRCMWNVLDVWYTIEKSTKTHKGFIWAEARATLGSQWTRNKNRVEQLQASTRNQNMRNHSRFRIILPTYRSFLIRNISFC